MADSQFVMMCLRCGYRNQAKDGDPYSKRDRAHHRRCNYIMTIRMVDESGRILGWHER